ncbi:MAG: hypothetical protein R6U68_05300 [Desulfobacteraceae bacterium]
MADAAQTDSQFKKPSYGGSGLSKEPHSEIIARVRKALDIDDSSPERFADSLPFSCGDTTCGCENEFQAVVTGCSEDVDLPAEIRTSSWYTNLLKQNARDGGLDKKIAGIEQYLTPCAYGSRDFSAGEDAVWENSWVCFPRKKLNLYAGQILEKDMLRDKTHPSAGSRSDKSRFLVKKDQTPYLRVPVSYLLKLSLAQAVGNPSTHHRLRMAAKKMMDCFINDNSSPEVLSFFPSGITAVMNQDIPAVRETSVRFVLVQLLTAYAGIKLGLKENKQQVRVYFASHTPHRQRLFNNLIPDSLYRSLFMSPCLSGWNRGQEKMAYMHLCHRVLSRSRMNALTKLRDAGIITSNLVVLPNISDISLANNGTHVSLGSKKITALLGRNTSAFTPEDEKYLGDLCIKICEHFIPLFVGLYSASPYRLDFQDFHPEKILGFLPHELDFMHLRMLWKQWKKKAGIKICSRPVTPFGPELMDRIIQRVFCMKGDLIPDFRLLDYFIAALATEENSALDGSDGNEARLAKDLKEMGVFDDRMPLYMLMRLRKKGVHGFSGIEARYYSTFESLFEDFGEAVQLQRIIFSFAWKLILEQEITHEDIPDTPEIESERRQIFFGAAMGIKTVFVNKKTANRLMQIILSKIHKKNKLFNSITYPGYYKFEIKDYLAALMAMITDQGEALINAPELLSTIKNAEKRVRGAGSSRTADRMVENVLKQAKAGKATELNAETFNQAAERYMREGLRKKHMSEGFKIVEEDLQHLELWAGFRDTSSGEILRSILGSQSLSMFLEENRDAVLNETATQDVLEKMIQLIVLSMDQQQTRMTQ